ncbi:unnamed protein product [Rotaria socialis]
MLMEIKQQQIGTNEKVNRLYELQVDMGKSMHQRYEVQVDMGKSMHQRYEVQVDMGKSMHQLYEYLASSQNYLWKNSSALRKAVSAIPVGLKCETR